MIQKIKPSEIDILEPIGQAFADSVKYPGGFKLSALKAVWVPLISVGVGEIFAAFDGDKVVGAFGAVFSEDPFSGWLTAAEQWWFVLPEYRKSKLGLQLFKAFEDEAASRGARKLMMITLEGKFSDGLSALYESRGYFPVERSFWKLT